MISSRIKIDTYVKYRFTENAKAPKTTTTDSAQRSNSVLSRAFAAQRLELFEQPSSSKDLRLTALDKLEQRGFKPALGGLEIPLTGKAMGGMPKRISRTNALILSDHLPPEAARQYAQEDQEIRNQIAQQQNIFNLLKNLAAQPNQTEEQHQHISERLEEAANKLYDLQIRLDQLPERLRQAERGRRQSSSAESSSHAGSQRGWHSGSYSGSRRG